MKKRTVKSLPEYKNNVYEEDKIIKSKKIKRKMPTSISLSPEVVKELKQIAEAKGIPYQVLMRSFILDGLRRLKAIS